MIKFIKLYLALSDYRTSIKSIISHKKLIELIEDFYYMYYRLGRFLASNSKIQNEAFNTEVMAALCGNRESLLNLLLSVIGSDTKAEAARLGNDSGDKAIKVNLRSFVCVVRSLQSKEGDFYKDLITFLEDKYCWGSDAQNNAAQEVWKYVAERNVQGLIGVLEKNEIIAEPIGKCSLLVLSNIRNPKGKKSVLLLQVIQIAHGTDSFFEKFIQYMMAGSYESMAYIFSDAGIGGGAVDLLQVLNYFICKIMPNIEHGKMLAYLRLIYKKEKNEAFRSHHGDDPSMEILKEDLAGFIKDLYIIFDPNVSSASSQDRYNSIQRGVVEKLIKPGVESHTIPAAITTTDFDKQMKSLLRIENSPLLKQAVNNKLPCIDMDVVDVTRDMMVLCEYPSIKFMLLHKKPLIRLSSLRFIVEKGDLSANRSWLESNALVEILKSADETLGSDNLAITINSLIKKDEYQLSDIPAFLKYACALHNTTRYSCFIQELTHGTKSEILRSITEWSAIAHSEKFRPRPVSEIFAELRSASLISPLSGEELLKLQMDFESIDEKVTNLLEMNIDDLVQGLGFKVAEYKNSPQNNECKLSIFAYLREIFKRELGIFPYNLQIINCLALLNHPKNIAQIKTGEGKSTVIAMLCAFRALTGSKVDVITTSKDLAVRDSDKYSRFYHRLKLTSGHIEKTYLYSRDLTPDILYGTVSGFEGIELRGRIRSGLHRQEDVQREYCTVIIDEVDNMLIDTARNGTVLASESSSVTALFQALWLYGETKAVTNALTTSGLRKYLYERNDLPESLKSDGSLTVEQLGKWIESIRKARTFKLNVEYSIVNKSIVIVDYRNTGAILTGNRWPDGLHEIIEAKHGLEIGRNNGLTSAKITHADFFNLYREIIGVTGTLGTNTDRMNLSIAYSNLRCYDSPPYRQSKSVGIEHKVCSDRASQLLAIESCAQKMINAGRPILIICESIDESMQIHQKLSNSSGRDVYLYNAVQEESAASILALAGASKAITVATNTAGRGADIIPTKVSIDSGGLHVIVTFPTQNKRVEEQAFGRAGRQGNPGSYGYILDYARLRRACLSQGGSLLLDFREESSASLVEFWQNARDDASSKIVQDHMLSIANNKLIFSFFKLFTDLPESIVNRCMSSWPSIYHKLIQGEGPSSREVVIENIAEAAISLWPHIIACGGHPEDISLASPLHFALAKNNEEMVEVLLRCASSKKHGLLFVPDESGHYLFGSNVDDYSDVIKKLMQTAYSSYKLTDNPESPYECICRISYNAATNEFRQKLDSVRLQQLSSDFLLLTKMACVSIFKAVIHKLGALGYELLDKLLKNNKLNTKHIISLMQKSMLLFKTSAYVEFLHLISDSSFVEIEAKISVLLAKAHKERFEEPDLHALRDLFLTPSTAGDKDVVVTVCSEKFDRNFIALSSIFQYSEQMVQMSDDQLLCTLKGKLASNGGAIPLNNKAEVLSVIRECYKRTFGIHPYNVQMMNVLLLLDGERNIAQIKTGEGKSTIVAILSAYLVLSGEKVSNITSSDILAERDVGNFKPFYAMFNISCGHGRRDSFSLDDFSNDIIYGQIHFYEFSLLESMLAEKSFADSSPITKRLVIADEVDSMFLDQMQSGAYLSGHGSRFRETTYRKVWQYYMQTVQNDDASDLRPTAYLLRQHLLDNSEGDENQFYSGLPDNLLDKWLKSAKLANNYEQDNQYIIEQNDAGMDCVTIMDVATGQRQEGLRWNDGLHAFVEIKHGITVRGEQLRRASVENCTYLNLHKRLIGLSGTLGARDERAIVETLYNTRMYDSPRQRQSCATRLPCMIVDDYENKIAYLKSECINMALIANRAVLVICRTILDARSLFSELQGSNLTCQIYDGMQDASNEHVLAFAGTAGMVTIATNNAGRGADIIPLSEVVEQGGLHVFLSYLPENSRIEWQAYGRSGRQGVVGSSQMVLEKQEIYDVYRHTVGSSTSQLQNFMEQRSDPQVMSLSQARTLHNRQKLLFDALVVFSKLPDEIRKNNDHQWCEFYTRMEDAKTQVTGFREYKIALQTILREFWEGCVAQSGLLSGSIAKAAYDSFIRGQSPNFNSSLFSAVEGGALGGGSSVTPNGGLRNRAAGSQTM